MKIYNKIVYDINDNIIEEDSYEYNGPIAKCDWITAAVVGASAVAGIQQAGAIGKYTKSAFDRKAKVDEQKAEAIENQLTIDLSTFDKKFRELEGTTIVNTNKSGVVEGSGSSQLIKLSNLFQKEIEKSKMRYNAEIGKAQAFENAAFSRIEGTIAKQRARMEQIKIAGDAGTSLLAMKG